MHSQNERGIALVLALFLMTALSVVGSSMMFLSQTETYASMNYRMMSQARYAGEAGVQKAADFILDDFQYNVPAVGAADDLLNYNKDVSPVLCLVGCATLNAPVVLSTDDTTADGDPVEANYPVPAVQAAFKAAAAGMLAAGNTNITYSARAELIAMQEFPSYGGTDSVVQTWRITGIGGLDGPREATVEVEALIETPRVSANSYAAFATADGCGAMEFNGGVVIDSYDSSQGTPATTTETTGGDVGTNGNLTIGGHVEVQGNLYSPRVGVGECEEGAVTALTETASADVAGSLVQLPKPVTYPLPNFGGLDATRTDWIVNNSVTMDSAFWVAAAAANAADPTTACVTLGLIYEIPPVAGAFCTVNTATNTITIDGKGGDVYMPNVTVGNSSTLIFNGADDAGNNVIINSMGGSGDLEFASNLTGPLNESVVLQLYGKEADGTTDLDVPMDLSSIGWKQNSAAESYDASALQLVYGGSGSITLEGNDQSAMTIYAPNADFVLSGTADLYGSVLARTVTNNGGGDLHYDRRLQTEFWVEGQPMIGTFTWKRY